jgi:hypothetical protein
MTNSDDTVRPLLGGGRSYFASMPYREKAELMRKATDWLSTLGIRYDSTRIDKYLRDLKRLNQARENDTVQELIDNEEFPSLVNSLFESSDVISIYQSLQSFSVGPLGQRLRDFVRGAEFANVESGDSIANRGRDVGFELYMASLFSRAGYELDFGTQADIVATDSDCTLIIECKRPRFDHSVRSNSKEAAKQIAMRLKSYDSGKKVFGIICLSGERVINPMNQLVTATDQVGINQFLEAKWLAFAESHEQDWRQPADPRLLGIMMLLRAPGSLADAKMMATCRFLGASSFQLPGKPGYHILDTIYAKLGTHLTDI